MKKVLLVALAGMSLFVGASAFAKGGGGDGGSRTFAATMQHRDEVMAQYRAEHPGNAQTEVAQK